MKLMILISFFIVNVACAQSAKLSTGNADCDYPAVCRDGANAAWAVWQQYDNITTDHLQYAHFKDGKWSTAQTIPNVSGDLFKAACAVDNLNRLVVVYSLQKDSNFDLWYVLFDGKKWSEPARVTAKSGNDFFVRLITTKTGVAAVWQGWSKDNYEILFSQFDNDAWSQPENISSDKWNDWAPDITCGIDGTISICWDSYRNGNYDVFVRQKINNEWKKTVPITGNDEFEANSHIAVGPDGAVWITYEQRQNRWGKSKGLIQDQLDQPTLAGKTKIKVRSLKNGKIVRPVDPLKQKDGEADHYPVIKVGRDGLVWLVFHRPQAIGYMKVGKWNLPTIGQFNYAVYFDGKDWSQPISLETSPSRDDSDLDAVILDDGRLLGVWHSDDRIAKTKTKFTDNHIYANVLKSQNVKLTTPRLEPSDVFVSNYQIAAAQKERKDVKAARDYTIALDGKTYHLFRGDLHRHTIISWDGVGDGTILDLFRYAMDTAALDFVAITDHNQVTGVDNQYVWWRTQKLTDVFNAEPSFISFFGYERSMRYPNGHRNVIEPKRGFRSLPMKQAPNDTQLLYEHVRKTGGITIPHTPGSTHGTNWKDKDPFVEPIVEIFQGRRLNYEYPGAPLSDRDNTSLESAGSGYQPAGFVWEAWKKGYRIGVIASSDHQSNHCSYANVWSDTATRQGLIDAMRKRHTFGSTDNIIIDFRCGQSIQGDEISLDKLPEFTIRIVGTSPIEEIVLFKNLKQELVIHPEKSHVEFKWQDKNPNKGENHYYVRIRQQDGNIAWSSPLWINIK